MLWRKGGPLVNDPTPGVQPGDYGYWRARFGNAALGDFKPRMDITPGGSLTIKEGAVLYLGLAQRHRRPMVARRSQHDFG